LVQQQLAFIPRQHDAEQSRQNDKVRRAVFSCLAQLSFRTRLVTDLKQDQPKPHAYRAVPGIGAYRIFESDERRPEVPGLDGLFGLGNKRINLGFVCATLAVGGRRNVGMCLQGGNQDTSRCGRKECGANLCWNSKRCDGSHLPPVIGH
jgi:hypothetical protein